jgi:hyperosmotically inducible periplasmic protein
MRTIGLISFVIGGALVVLSMASCGTVATNINANNANTRNMNSNTAVVVNATPANTSRTNSDPTREEYDKNRAEYEREKGSSTIGQGIDDSWVWFKTKTALAATNDLRDSTINVDVVDGIITLNGSVATAAQKTMAETVAKTIDRNKGVKNQLTVRPTDSVTNQVVNGNTSGNRRP